MTIDLFQDLKDVPVEKLHPKFSLLKREVLLDGERAILKDWVQGFADRDNKIVKEFQTTFHSALWEFFLFALCKEAGLTIDFAKNRPDFIITHPNKLYIEAVVSEIKKDGRVEADRGLDDILSMGEPPWIDPNFQSIMDEAITRYSNAILSKRNKFINEYSKLQWVDTSVPFIIALSSYSQVNYGKEYHYPMLALLLGFYFDHSNGEYKKKENIIKPNTSSEIPINIFSNPEMADVAAVIFSCTITMGKLTSLAISQSKSTFETNFVINIRHDNEEPFFKIQEVSAQNQEYLSDGVFVFHNPNAKCPLSKEIFKNTNVIQVYMDGSTLCFEGENLPLVARLNLLKMLLPESHRGLLISDIFYKFNDIDTD